jgi:hypothetical protein
MGFLVATHLDGKIALDVGNIIRVAQYLVGGNSVGGKSLQRIIIVIHLKGHVHQ